jgi:hypothetical protein
MSEPHRTPLAEDLVAQMAAASGRPVAQEDLAEVTGLIDALYDLETHLARFDVSGVEPEFKWDARWEKAE